MLKKFEDYILEQYLTELNINIDLNNDIILNEEFKFDSLKHLNKEELKLYFNKLIKLLNNVTDIIKRQNIIKILFVVYTAFYSYDKISNTLDKQNVDNLKIEQLAKTSNLTTNILLYEFNKIFNFDKKQEVKKDINDFKTSEEGIKTIKQHEGYSEKAYKLGDGMITVGWGHAEKIRHAKIRVGQIISENQAIRFFNSDLKKAEDGIKRMFNQWKEQGVEIDVTQGMFDSLVSLSFNMGITGLRRTHFIEELKKGNIEKAANLIPTTGNSGRFGGIKNRRQDEKQLFLADLGKIHKIPYYDKEV